MTSRSATSPPNHYNNKTIKKMATSTCGSILEVMKLIISPVDTSIENNGELNQSREDPCKGDLTRLLQINLTKLHRVLQQDPFIHLQQDIKTCKEIVPSSQCRNVYLETCLQLLVSLKTTLLEAAKEQVSLPDDNFREKRPHDYAPSLPPASLSVGDQKIVLALTQFVVCLGIGPNLAAGVGIPLSMRTEFSDILKDTNESCDLLLESTKKMELSRVARVLLDCIEEPTLGGMILSKYLNDILATLIQLSFRPQKSTGKAVDSSQKIPLMQNTSHQKEESSRVKLIGCQHELNDDRYIWRQQLQSLIDKVYQPMVIRELLLLQGSPSRRSLDKTGAKTSLPRAPAWLRKACGQLLSERLMRNNGVQNVLRGILNCTGADSVANWKQCEVVAKLLANCPKQLRLESYYLQICPQVLELLHSKDVLSMKQFLRIACSFINDIIMKQPELGKMFLIQPLQQPLLKCIKTDSLHAATPGTVIIQEDILTQCIEDLHKVYVTGSEPTQELIQSIKPIIHPLFNLYVFLINGISHLRSLVEETLLKFFKMTDTASSVILLRNFALLKLDSLQDVMSPLFTFVPGPRGGAMVKVVEDDRSSETVVIDVIGDHDVIASALLQLLNKLKMDKLLGDFFISILQELTNIVAWQPMELRNEESVPARSILLQLETDQLAKLHDIQHALVVFNLVAKLCEEMGPAVLENTTHMLAFVRATLQRACQTVEKNAEPDSQKSTTFFEDETLSMALGLLTLIMSAAMQIQAEHRNLLTTLLPLLETIANKHKNGHLQRMAVNIQVTIATHGAVKTDQLTSSSGQDIKKKDTTKEGNLLVTMETTKTSPNGISVDYDHRSNNKGLESTQEGSTDLIEGVANKENTEDFIEISKTKLNKDIVSEAFDEAYKELFDPLLPVRGHALIALAKLVPAKDPKAMEKKDVLYMMFMEKLTDDDSYIYLAAIQGLVAMASVFPAKVVPGLCSEYANWEGHHDASNRTNQVRMTVGEALVKATQNLGELVPYYGNDLLAAILTVTKDPCPEMRASSLSTLGEVCKLLKFSLGSNIHEVMNCLVSILQTDSQLIVRRACVNVITLMLRGLGKEATTVLESVMLNLYRILKVVARTEQDDVLILHTQLALHEMDTIARDYLFPKQTLTKKIVVLP